MKDLTIPAAIGVEEFAQRRARLQEKIAADGLQGVVVISRGAAQPEWGADVFYLTNHYTHFCQLPDREPSWAGHGHSAVIMPAEGEATLVLDLPDWRQDLVSADDVRVATDVWRDIGRAIKDRGLGNGRLGLVGEQTLTFRGDQLIREINPGLEWVRCEQHIEALRRIKSPAEIELMRHSCEVGAEMMTAFMETVAPGVTEADCVAEGWAAGIRRGAWPWDTCVGAGPWTEHFAYHRNPAWDHTRPLEAGELIHPDFFGTVGGYQYDLVRTAVVGGRATDAQRRVLQGAVDVVEHIIDHVKPGRRVSELFLAGAEWYVENGFSPPGAEAGADPGLLGQMFPSFGHGIGMTWEHPFLTADEQLELEPGMTLAIEVQVGDAEAGTAGFEHDVLVTEDGAEILTTGVANAWWD